MMRRLVILLCALSLGSLLAACGRVGDPDAPPGTRADVPRVPNRGSTILYPY